MVSTPDHLFGHVKSQGEFSKFVGPSPLLASYEAKDNTLASGTQLSKRMQQNVVPFVRHNTAYGRNSDAIWR